jgi:hypothetical protein
MCSKTYVRSQGDLTYGSIKKAGTAGLARRRRGPRLRFMRKKKRVGCTMCTGGDSLPMMREAHPTQACRISEESRP